MYILGIQFGNHDASAALLRDGEIIAAVSEERVTRRKKDRRFPFGAITDVLTIASVVPKDIERIAIAGTEIMANPDFDRLFVRGEPQAGRASHLLNLYHFLVGQWYRPVINRNRLRRELSKLGFSAPISYFDHHLCHAASAYYTAGESDPLIITLDGEGDSRCSCVAVATEGTLKVLHSTPWYSSPGLFYSFITEWLGMKRVHHEGKVTGLAAYGNVRTYRTQMETLLRYDEAHNNFLWPFLSKNIIDSFLLKTRLRWWISVLQRHTRLPKVTPKSSFTIAADIAAAAQDALERSVLSFIRSMITQTGRRRLALAGGVFANVKLNQRIAELSDVESVFIHPAMGDDGIALGAAFLAAHEVGEARMAAFKSAYLGPAYSGADIEVALVHHPVTYEKPQDLEDTVAEILVRGKAVALFQGRMEYGPRALGNRSVLCSPHDKSVNDWLNKQFNRTEFMPFAPVTLANHLNECYTGLKKAERAAHFMTICTPCTPEMERTQPAVVHVDSTARPQLITKEENPRYWGILKKFHEKTGLPSLINTSFNMHEEPIVRSPDDALRAFLASGLPYLVLEDYLVVSLNTTHNSRN